MTPLVKLLSAIALALMHIMNYYCRAAMKLKIPRDISIKSVRAKCFHTFMSASTSTSLLQYKIQRDKIFRIIALHQGVTSFLNKIKNVQGAGNSHRTNLTLITKVLFLNAKKFQL